MAFTPEQIIERREARKLARRVEKQRQWDAAMVQLQFRRAREDEERRALLRDEQAKFYDKIARTYRADACFDSANEAEEAAFQVRHYGRTPSLRGSVFQLDERVVLSKTREWLWDQLTDEGVVLEHPRPHGPSRNGSSYCESGSIASGGTRTYCTCDRCW